MGMQLSGSLELTGSFTTSGAIVAQTLVVQTITSSITQMTGSNVFGSSLSNTQKFTGSVLVTGSFTTNGAATFSSNVTATSFISDGASNEGAIRIERDTVSTNTTIGSLIFTNNNAATTYGKVFGGRNSAGDGYVALGTGVSNNLYATETGYVGIGTASPAQLLEVVGGEIKAGRVDTGSEGGQVSFGRSTDNSTAWYIDAYGNVASPQLRFLNVVDPAITMILTGSSVGIGTSSPASGRKLTVAGGAQFTYTDNGGASFNIVPGATGQAGADFNLSYYTGTGYGPLTFTLGGSEKMRIGSDGYVGIGTTSPSSKVTIVRDSPFNTGDQALRIRATDGDGYNLWMGASTSGYATIQSYQDNVGGATLLLNPLNGGQVFIRTTAAFQSSETLCVLNSGTTSIFSKQEGGSSAWVQKMWNNATSGNNNILEFLTETSLTARGSVTYNRGSGVIAYNTTSDYRIKSEISDFNALDILLNLNPKEFRINNSINKTIGFIAHELQEYLPQAVTGEKDAEDEEGNPVYQSVDYSQLTALLTKAIQELEARVKELENK